MHLSMLVEEHVGGGKFNVTNSCRHDVPRGTQLTFLSAESGTIQDGQYSVTDNEPPENVSLFVAEIEFWRKTWDCVPYGHHARVRFEGEGVARLVEYLAKHRRPWHVSVRTALCDG